MTVIAIVFVVVIGAALAIVATVILGLRFRSRPVRRMMSIVNRRFINPRTLETAGTAESPWAVVKHRGRISGRQFSTPVQAVEGLGGYVIALPYGPEAQWVRNVQAASHAVLVTRGVDHEIGAIDIVDLSTTPLGATSRIDMWLFGVRSAAVLRPAP